MGSATGVDNLTSKRFCVNEAHKVSLRQARLRLQPTVEQRGMCVEIGGS